MRKRLGTMPRPVMRLTERYKRVPSGLARFLGDHEDCPKGFEILRDRSLVTVVCRGCDSSFSYLTDVAATEPTEVERALSELADGGSSSGDAVDPQANGRNAPKAPPQPEWAIEPTSPPRREPSPKSDPAPPAGRDAPGPDPAPADPPAVDPATTWRSERRLKLPIRPRAVGGPGPAANEARANEVRANGSGAFTPPSPRPPLPSEGPRRLPPPGPHARRRAHAPHHSLREDIGRRIRAAGDRLTAAGGRADIGARAGGVATAIAHRRRPIAMAAMSLAGAYIVLALSTGGEPGATDPPDRLGTADLPLQAAPPGEAEDPVAGDARTLEPLEGGGPDAAPVEGGDGSFEVMLPPGWERGTTDEGGDLYESASGAASVLIKVETESGVGLGTLADRGAAFLAIRLSPGAEVKRIPAREEGDLLAVARSSGGDQIQVAYVASAGDTHYMVVSGYEEAAPALDRLEAESVVRSFEPADAGKSG